MFKRMHLLKLVLEKTAVPMLKRTQILEQVPISVG